LITDITFCKFLVSTLSSKFEVNLKRFCLEDKVEPFDAQIAGGSKLLNPHPHKTPW
jgi:hypothetical protein